MKTIEENNKEIIEIITNALSLPKEKREKEYGTKWKRNLSQLFDYMDREQK